MFHAASVAEMESVSRALGGTALAWAAGCVLREERTGNISPVSMRLDFDVAHAISSLAIVRPCAHANCVGGVCATADDGPHEPSWCDRFG